MFYSQLLLSKKGSLGIVWMAAHCHRSLKKDLVLHTNISSSVDKILVDEVPSVTHRILAFLLLGVVRIYSKKVEYLFHDCHEIMNKLHGFSLEKTKGGGTGTTVRDYHSIKIPKRLELDTFDLEHLDGQDLECENVCPSEELLLEDGCPRDRDTCGLIFKDLLGYVQNIIPFPGASCSASTPMRDVVSPCQMGKALFVMPSSKCAISLAGGTNFCLEDCLDPIVLDEAEDQQMCNKPHEEDSRMNVEGPTEDMDVDMIVDSSINLSHSSPSFEMLRRTQFPLEDSLDHMALDEAKKDQMNGRMPIDIARTDFQMSIQEMEFSSDTRTSPQSSNFLGIPGALNISGCNLGHSPNFKMLSESLKGQDSNEPSGCECDVKHLMTRVSFQDEDVEPHCLTKSTDQAKLTKFLKVITPESGKGQTTDEFSVSVAAPDLKLPGTGNRGATGIQTPVTTEHRNIMRKKILFDQATVLSNEVLKRMIEDPIHLRRKRKPVPLTCLGAWRAQKLNNLTQSLLDPNVFGMSVDVSPLLLEMTSTAAVKLVEQCSNGHDTARSAIANEDQKQMPGSTSPVMEGSCEQTPFAPGTPVTQMDSLHSHDIGTVADLVTFNPITPPEVLVTDEETIVPDKDNPERETNSEIYSARTRMTQDYLGRKFLDKGRKNEDPVLNMSELMEGKTKADGAKLFYDILVLKSRDCIDVEQVNAYGDILLLRFQ